SQALSGFWSTVNVRRFVRNPGDPQPDPTTPAPDLFNKGLDLDRAIVTAALPATGPLPLQKAPLAMLLGDALKSLSDRIHDATGPHDLACTYLSCNGRHTEVSELISLFAAVSDQAELQRVINGLTVLPMASTPANHRAWVASFGNLRDQHLN